MKTGFYKCDFCYTFCQDKTLMKKHEESCLYNPKNKHCNSCTHRKLKIDKVNDTYEYICNKGYQLNLRTNIVACNSTLWKLCSPKELKIRSEKKEF